MTDQLVSTLPITRTCPYAPPAEHVRLRDQAPIAKVTLPSGMRAWVLTRLEDVRLMLADPRFSADRTSPNFPLLMSVQQLAKDGFKPSMISMDPPEHRTARRAVIAEFTVKRTAALRPRIQQIVDEHIDAMLAGPRPTDLVQALALPVPSLVICELLGVPYADHNFFQTRSAKIFRHSVPPPERVQSRDELLSYLDDLVSAKEAEPSDDLLGRQIVLRRRDGTENHRELVELAFLLLVAGHETTANMISLGTFTLIEHPEALAKIKADPGKTPAAVEELLRYYTIAEFATCRFAKEDVEIGGVAIRAGEGVVGLTNTANRDPEGFEDPDRLDIERGARHHVAFGFGAHQCLGQNLARTELQIVFDTLFARIPNLELSVPVPELHFKDDGSIYGLYELPVTW